MIEVSSRNDILSLFKENLGSGEESTVGLLSDGEHVAKAFNQPHDMKEKYDLLIGRDLGQSSYCFFNDLYANQYFILGGISDYALGESVSSNIQRVDFIDLLYSTLVLKKDTKIISEAGIMVGDCKDFNMKFTDEEIKIVDVGRFKYSSLDKKELYRYNLEMIFSVIKSSYSNDDFIKALLIKEEKLNKLYKNNEKFPEFFIELQKSVSKELNENISNIIEYKKKKMIR